jgi:hypothetical protein
MMAASGGISSFALFFAGNLNRLARPLALQGESLLSMEGHSLITSIQKDSPHQASPLPLFATATATAVQYKPQFVTFEKPKVEPDPEPLAQLAQADFETPFP